MPSLGSIVLAVILEGESERVHNAERLGPGWFENRFKAIEKRTLAYCEQHNHLPHEAEEAFDELVSDVDPQSQSNAIELLRVEEHA